MTTTEDERIDRRYAISEVCEILDLRDHVLREWEKKIPQLRPGRNRAKQRYYLKKDIEIARRIKQLVRYEGMTLDGARIQIAKELRGEGRPKTNRDFVERIDALEDAVRAMIDQIDRLELEG
jgi:DNA-binding transcriptional MerR regulator